MLACSPTAGLASVWSLWLDDPVRDSTRRHALRHLAIVLAVLAILVGCSSTTGAGSPSTTTVPQMESPTAAVDAIISGLQLDLQALGYDPGPVSGQFSAQTRQALTKFQVNEGVPAGEHGAIGPPTAQALQRRLPGASEAVRALQSALTDVGLFQGMINGIYDAQTLAAVKALQGKSHLPVDGLFGTRTADALAKRYGVDVPEPPVATTTSLPSPVQTSTTVAPADLLKLGSKGPKVTDLQTRLTALGYRPGPADGVYGTATASAVLAFEKRQGITRDGVAGPQLQAALDHPTGAGPRAGLPGARIEVDIARQIAFVVLPSQPVITLNVSTGNGKTYAEPGGGTDIAYTPVGSFTVIRKIVGDEKAPLGTLHSPMYFYKGWAIHGAASVPAYPASHGCVRISDTDADWLFPQIPIGTAIILYDSTGHSPSLGQLPTGAAPGY
jgi:peptidoglycan hydrolase-like protein with peptidoglycan-binding domain